MEFKNFHNNLLRLYPHEIEELKRDGVISQEEYTQYYIEYDKIKRKQDRDIVQLDFLLEG